MELLKNYDSVKELRNFLEKNKLSMKKRFGQNFLVSPGAREKILSVLDIQSGEKIWEIGPGLGALTHEIVKRAGSLTVFEIDHGFIRYLTGAFGSYPGFNLVEGDVVRTWKNQRDNSGSVDKIIGNLPYSAASAIISGFIEGDFVPSKMVFTVQKEMGDRMTAPPGSRNYSSFSMLCQFRCRIIDRGNLNAGAFYPPPDVLSKVVEMVPHQLYNDVDNRIFFSLIHDLFLFRRKKIRNNIFKGRLIEQFPRDRIISAFRNADINMDDRGENIDLPRAVKASMLLGQ